MIQNFEEFINESKWPDEYLSTSWWKDECNKINGISLLVESSTMLNFVTNDKRRIFTVYFVNNKISNPIPKCFYPGNKFADAPIVVQIGSWTDLAMELDKNKMKIESGKDYLGCYLIQTEKDAKTFIKCVKKIV